MEEMIWIREDRKRGKDLEGWVLWVMVGERGVEG